MSIENAQGAAGEAESQPSGSGTSDAELQAALGSSTPAQRDIEPEFAERLKGLSPDAIRRSLSREQWQEIEKPFLSDHTRKTQALAKEREHLLDRMLAREGREAPAPDERRQLLDRLKQGDLDVIDQYLAKEVSARVEPLKAQMDLQTAYQEALTLHPYIGTKGQEIGQVISGDPRLVEMVQMAGHRFLPIVLQGAAMSLENQELKAWKANTEKNIEAIVKKRLADVSQQARSLPPQTSKAGSTPTATPSEGGKVLGFYAAGVKALEELGIPVDPYVRRRAEEGQ